MPVQAISQSVVAAGPDPAAKVFPQSASCQENPIGAKSCKLTALGRILGSSIDIAKAAAVCNAGLVRHGSITSIAGLVDGAANVPK